jgi:DNA repair photolyase
MVPERQISEITVKSVLNPVKGMPFRWSINPYRGCSHGCVFCQSGDTPILMADGTTKRLDMLRIGDEVMGTVRRLRYRYYTATPVLACWRTEKPAFRVILQDGTELVASDDHRFLSDRGWKFLTGTDQGTMRRPHLTLNNSLMGTGAFAKPPTKDADYERGYLCGIIRGDGSLGFYQYDRAGRSHGNQWHFRLALTDGEALVRSRDYLRNFTVTTQVFGFQRAQGNWRSANAIRTSARQHVETIQRIIVWPEEPSLEWCKGFLAGIFDAEGTTAGGSLRISNTDPAIIDCTVRCLTRFGFALVLEHPKRDTGKAIICIRILGGLRERLRFFHSVDPVILRKRNLEGWAVKNASIPVVSVQPLGIRQLIDITTGTGDFIANGIISHNCYARRTHWFLEEDGVQDWSSKIFVKVNAPDVLRSELRRHSWKREEVALGTATDPYQAIERKYKVTRRILEALCESRTPVSIVTRSPMILRDIDVLTDLARRAAVTVCVSIVTTDPRMAREIEPTVALPAQRLRTVQRLSEAGIRAGVILAPILPGLTDDPANLDAVMRAARDHGAHFVSHNVLHLGEVTRDAFFQFLKQRHPALVPRYLRMYRGKYAPDAYRADVSEIVEASKQQHGVQARRHLTPPAEPAQLPLFAG